MTPSIPVVVTLPSLTPIHQELESVAMPDPSALMGQSMSKTDLAGIEQQRIKRVKDFLESKGPSRPDGTASGKARQGVGTELLSMMFRGDQLGDGSNAVVYLDVSGSMKGINADVRRYMESKFPSALVREIPGCAMKKITDPFPATILSEKNIEQRTEFFFVCDLQDGIKETVVKALRQFVTSGDLPRHLHLVSFDQVPSAPLLELLQSTGGSFLHLPPQAGE